VNTDISQLDYSDFVSSASSFITHSLQEKLRVSTILIAGNGSIGNPIAMMLARSGAEHIINADPENVEISNLARQEYFFTQVGKNKAEMTSENILAINPNAKSTIISVPEGIAHNNVEELVKISDIVVDGIDIRASDLAWQLHNFASKMKKPVIVGYDLAGTAMLTIYRYDKKSMKPLNGDIPETAINEFIKIKSKYFAGKITEGQYLDYVYDVLTGPINPFLVPIEQFKEIINRNSDDKTTGQIGTTARLISVLVVEAIKQILSGADVKDVISIDAPSQVRLYNPSIFLKLKFMLWAIKIVKQRRKKAYEISTIINSL